MDTLLLHLQLVYIACLGKIATESEDDNIKEKKGYSMCEIYVFNIVGQTSLTRSSIILTKIKIL